MLKKKIITALCVISFALPAVAAEQPSNEPVKKSEWGKFIGKTATSVLLGGLIGAAEGELCRRFENYMAADMLKEKAYGQAFITCMICWAITSSAREGILNAVKKIMEKHNVDESFDLVKNSSHIASWLAYLRAWPFNITMPTIPNVLIFGQRDANGWIRLNS